MWELNLYFYPSARGFFFFFLPRRCAIAAVDVGLNFLSKNLTAESHEQTNDPSTISASDFSHKKPVSICTNEICSCDLTKIGARNRIRIRTSFRNAKYLSFFKFKETLFLFFTFFFLLIIQRVPVEEHTMNPAKNYLSG